MTILVSGASGTVGRQIVEQLVKRGADVRALVRDRSEAAFSAGVGVERLATLLSRPLHSYSKFPTQAATSA